MTFFSNVHLTSLVLLGGLLGYTLWLLRTGRLNPHVAVRWILAGCAAILAVLLWRWLPLFRITSTMGDRELLMVLVVIFFVLIAFLMLDSLVRISTHNTQVKRLAQELALLREQVDKALPGSIAPALIADEVHEPDERDRSEPAGSTRWRDRPIVIAMMCMWTIVCMALFVGSAHQLPRGLRILLTADYLK